MNQLLEKLPAQNLVDLLANRFGIGSTPAFDAPLLMAAEAVLELSQFAPRFFEVGRDPLQLPIQEGLIESDDNRPLLAKDGLFGPVDRDPFKARSGQGAELLQRDFQQILVLRRH